MRPNFKKVTISALVCIVCVQWFMDIESKFPASGLILLGIALYSFLNLVSELAKAFIRKSPEAPQDNQKQL